MARVEKKKKKPVTLDEFRAEIDALDEALHDLLIRRAEITREIAQVKRGAAQSVAADGEAGTELKLPPAFRPAREAQILRRLLARHKGDLPRRVIVRIWREIMAASLQAQSKFHVNVCDGEGQAGFGDLVHAHFGSLTPVHEYARAATVVHECAEEPDSLGVVPLPDMAETGVPWWASLVPPGQPGPRVIAKLPFIVHPDELQPAALAIGAVEQEESGDDTTLIRIEHEAGLSRARLGTLLKNAGFETTLMAAGQATEKSDFGAVLLAAVGFVPADDARLGAFRIAAGDAVLRADPVGGFANPIILTPVAR
jgi:chorismate mutase/prephenate dehydratase